jgi:xylulokinase
MRMFDSAQSIISFVALYIGFDSSTQSLTATVIETDGQDGRGTPRAERERRAESGPRAAESGQRRVVTEQVLVFDEALPEFKTIRGVHTSADGRTVTAPPAMWAAALDLMLARLRDTGVDLAAVRAVSGSAQQHGSVYLSAAAPGALAALDPARDLASQLGGIFARTEAPVWLDCSTSGECGELTAALGGAGALAALTGSRAYERFTAAQIRRFAATDPQAYAATARIHLVSSFMASVLCGADAPIDPGDASGMNLMDLARREWSTRAVTATAPDLARRLPVIRDSWSIAGPIAPYFRRRFGFGDARAVTWSGDNPCALIGLGLVEEGRLGISLGTSDTVFAATSRPDPDPGGSGHVFASPAGGYMALTCFANGSLARERVRDAYGLDWTGFSRMLADTPPGNGGALMVPWFAPEITPTVDARGPFRKDLDPADAARNVRAVVEGQAMAMRLHSRWFAPAVRTIRATGGAAVNAAILQVLADVFDAEVVRIAPPNAASLGAALRAFHADRLADGVPLPWTDVTAGFTDPIPDAGARPRTAAAATYAALLPQYAALVESLR